MSCIRSGAGYILLFAGLTAVFWKPIVYGLIVCGVGRASLSLMILFMVGATALVVRFVRFRE